MPPFERVLFDMDGVLVDSRDAISRSINHALVAHGVPPRPEAELHALIGAPLPAVFANLLAAAGRDPALASSCLDAYRDRYGHASLVETTPIPGIPEALEAVAETARLAVATTKPAEYARPILETLGLLRYFETVVGSPVEERRSEDKAVTIRRALEALGGDGPGAMIGDRHFDVRGGRANDLYTVGVTWGAGSVEELREAGADAILSRPEAIPALLAGDRRYD